MLKHVAVLNDGHKIELYDSERQNYIEIDGWGRSITFRRFTVAEFAQLQQPVEHGIVTEHLSIGPRDSVLPLKFRFGKRTDKAVIYQACTPDADPDRWSWQLAVAELSRAYRISLTGTAGTFLWDVFVRFDDLDAVYEKVVKQATPRRKEPAMKPHPTLRVNEDTLAYVLADMIEAGEGETFSSDDAENRPDPDTARMIASRMNIGSKVEAELQRRTPEPERVYITMIGNLSAGYKPVGPFPTFDDAAAFREDGASWIMEVTNPDKYTSRDD